VGITELWNMGDMVLDSSKNCNHFVYPVDLYKPLLDRATVVPSEL